MTGSQPGRHPTARVRSVRYSRRRVVTIVAALVLGLPLAGSVYEGYAHRRDGRRFPPPGRLVDVGGRRLHLVCIGAGQPTVIVEPAGMMNSMSATVVRTELAKRTQVCSYDRAGSGWSDREPDAVTIGSLTEDLRRLQDAAGLKPPFVIVASSVGGLVAELLARRHPERVAGIVMVDAATSDVAARLAPEFRGLETTVVCTASAVAGRIGLVRLADPFQLRSSSAPAAARTAALLYGAQPWRTLCALVDSLDASLGEFAAAPALPSNLPIVVLSAASAANIFPPRLAAYVNLDSRTPLRHDAHQRFARQSARGTWRVVPGSDHLIANSRPQAVVDAVLQVLAQAR